MNYFMLSTNVIVISHYIKNDLYINVISHSMKSISEMSIHLNGISPALNSVSLGQ